MWIPHVVAYRCRSCGISPCMSICRDCFKKGDHRNHDFNMFLSQAGGACDCGDTSVMKAEGFCCDHGVHNNARRTSVPGDLLVVAEAIMPRLLLRLLHHFRDKGERDRDRSKNDAIEACDNYCSMLMELNNMGELMRNVMTKTLLSPEVSARTAVTCALCAHDTCPPMHLIVIYLFQFFLSFDNRSVVCNAIGSGAK